MKTVIAAVASLALVGTASAATCSTAEQQSAYLALVDLIQAPSLNGCSTDSGYSLLSSTSLPTDEQYVKMCASDNCKSLISTINGKNLPNCDLTVPTSGLVLNVYEYGNGFATKCSSLSTTAPTPTSATPDATTATPDATTATPGTTTATPVMTTAAPSAC